MQSRGISAEQGVTRFLKQTRQLILSNSMGRLYHFWIWVFYRWGKSRQAQESQKSGRACTQEEKHVLLFPTRQKAVFCCVMRLYNLWTHDCIPIIRMFPCTKEQLNVLKNCMIPLIFVSTKFYNQMPHQ